MKKRIFSILFAVLFVWSMVAGFPVTVWASSSMSVSQQLLAVIKTMEGFHQKPYWDYGHWSVGYGSECPADKVEYYQKNGISQKEAETLLLQEMKRFENAVNGFMDRYGLRLQQHQFDALVSFSFNCGEAWMSDPSGYFHTAVREGGTVGELMYGICLYSTAGGEYALIGRRLCEANMYINGEYRAYNTGMGGNPDYLKYVFLDGNGGTTRYAVYGYDARQEDGIRVAFSSIPTGVDGEGKPFAYTLEGWYTEDGRKVEKLDSSLKNGQVLYARWVDPTGNPVSLPKGDPEDITVTVTGDSVNVRTGPATYYDRVDAYVQETAVPITEIYKIGGYTWGRSEKGWFRLDYTNYADLKAAQTQFPKEGVIIEDNVNVRTGPGTGYDRVGRMQRGERVTITEEAKGGAYRWGKLPDGTWICLDYVLYDEDARSVVSVALVQPPEKTDYVQNVDSLKIEGSIILVSYDNGTFEALSLTRPMITAYDNSQLGQTTVEAVYEGYAFTFQVNIIKATVTFLDWDGTVIASEQYAYGETITPPPDPTRENDGTYYYSFSGWDKEVLPCNGNATYTAVYQQSLDPDAVVVPQSITSDIYQVSDLYIRKIPADTTVATFISGIHESSYISVYNGETKMEDAAILGTGMTVKLQFEDNTIQSLTVVVTGDVNGDGGISITDLINVKGHVLGKNLLDGAFAQAADTNGDMGVSITDFIQIKAKLLGNGEITPN